MKYFLKPLILPLILGITIGCSGELDLAKANELNLNPANLSKTKFNDLSIPSDQIIHRMNNDENFSFAYVIQHVQNHNNIEKLVQSTFDMVVIEPTRTDCWEPDQPTSQWVSDLKNSNGSDPNMRKIVLAYVDMGQAEIWRYYWCWGDYYPVWDCDEPRPDNAPDWMLDCDPDGWSGIRLVKYWSENWQDIAIYGTESHPELNYNSLMDELIRDGFDGIYIDWVEAYENSTVIEAAEEDGIDPTEAMVEFLRNIREYGKERNPNFIVVQQNASNLINDAPESLDYIDAIAQEGIWAEGYGGFDEWCDPNGYDDILRDGDGNPDPFLTEYYLNNLRLYKEAGVPVFNVEYAVNRAAEVYQNSYNEGFIPLASRRSLQTIPNILPPHYLNYDDHVIVEPDLICE